MAPLRAQALMDLELLSREQGVGGHLERGKSNRAGALLTENQASWMRSGILWEA